MCASGAGDKYETVVRCASGVTVGFKVGGLIASGISSEPLAVCSGRLVSL